MQPRPSDDDKTAEVAMLLAEALEEFCGIDTSCHVSRLRRDGYRGVVIRAIMRDALEFIEGIES